MDKVLFLSGTTRGGTLEGICRSFAPILKKMNIELLELSLLDLTHLLEALKGIDLSSVRFVLSCVGMGLDLSITLNDRNCNLWRELGIPYITLHGDSPAYFFDRHVVPSNNFISLYAFSEHLQLRRRLPHVNGPVACLPPIILDELAIDEVDRAAKREGTLLFLKNGKNPLDIRKMWSSFADRRVLKALFEIADQVENNLDKATADRIEAEVTRYFVERDLDVQALTKLRLFFIAQLDDYIRAVKCTRIACALMDFPVEIRGNNWEHLDFTGKKATYIDDCNYVDSTQLIRGALGTIDMSANTASAPHDRVMRAYGARTLCLTNARQRFLDDLPYSDSLTFDFDKESLQSRVANLLSRKREAVDMGIEVAKQFRIANPPERAFELMLSYASLTKLDQTPARPTGLQDFFIWPPQLS